MGYYTDYTLTVTPNMEWEPIHEELEYLTGYKWKDDLSLSSVKWYSHHKQMLEFSKKFPSHLFILNGEGEETGDIWRNYYKNGKCQQCKAQIIIDEFDEGKLV